MGSLQICAAAVLSFSLLSCFCGVSPVLAQDLRETDALCHEDGCFVVYFQRKTFLASWRACRKKGGNLATIKRREEADTIATLLADADLRHSRTKVNVWIGLQRQPRQCTASRPLRGYSWTTGDQDTQYTNWLREDSPSLCSAPRCVVMGYSTFAHEQHDNFKWLDGSCSVPVDGYLCHYGYKGMCPALWSEGGGNALYTTPFDLLSTLLTHVPIGSVATLPCPAGDKDEQVVLCLLREDGTAGWSQDPPFCIDAAMSENWCEQNNGGCQHFCREAGAQYYCECSDGFQLSDDRHSCVADVCRGAPCEFECLPLSDTYRCACPDGYMLAPDDVGCVDVDECLQSPCAQLCVNTVGTFKCQCRQGYHLDEVGECEDVDECGFNLCEHACENTLGSHLCHCHLGYFPAPEDPSRCQDIDECQIPGTCDQMCVNYDSGFECHCEVGYELMSDNYSCQKIGEGDQLAVTPFPWGTHNPETVWDPEDPVYQWNPQQSHTDWPLEDEDALDWLTDSPSVMAPDVIWVTAAPQEDLLDNLKPPEPEEKEAKEEEEENEDGAARGDVRPHADIYEWEGKGLSGWTDVPVSTTTQPAASPTLTPDYDYDYDNQEEETTTGLSTLPTSTITEGAWNWLWSGSTPASQETGNAATVEPGIDGFITPESSHHKDGEEDSDHYTSPGSPQIPVEVVGVGEGGEDYQETVKPANPTVLSQRTSPTLPPSPSGEGVNCVDLTEGDGEQKQGSSWLLVGLLVPLCIVIVVMVVLGIVYCTRCAVQPRSKNATDCYHWISGAHDKQGAPNPPAGVKTNV
ncbi:CD248 molecule, endosialin a [Lampris incognitus]|uniref:CD248 molecule, endosialin a n=1 Tax=Lampris incognitus TaxID=2546036 RepID=UPI0024B4A1A4|nr:CD248 molecule, endosialin a [Lampris incognitus]